MIIKYYKGSYPLEYLKELTMTGVNGCSVYDIVSAANKLDLNPKAVSGDINLLKSTDYPLIAHVKKNNLYHFLVIFKKNKDSYIIGDPASNTSIIEKEELEELLTGHFILFHPVKKPKTYKENNYLYNLIINFLSDKRYIMLALLLLSIIISFLFIFMAMKIEILMDIALTSKSKDNLKIFISFILIIYLLMSLLDFLKNKLLLYINNSFKESLYHSLYEKILELPYLYHKSKSSGDILTRINDADNIVSYLSTVLIFLSDLVIAIFSFIILYFILKSISLSLVMGLFIFYFIYLLFIPLIIYYMEKQKEARSFVYEDINELLQNVELVKTYNIKKYKERHFFEKNRHFLNMYYKNNQYYNYLDAALSFLINSLELFIIYLVSLKIIQGNMNLGSLITVTTLTSIAIKPLSTLISLLIIKEDLILSVKRINSLFNIKKEHRGSLYLDSIEKLEFKDFSYAYLNKNNLEKVNLLLNKGDKVLIKGKSGSGKSTMFKALVKLFKTDNIYINDLNINDLNKKDLREKILYVSQNERILKGSILDNITFGRQVPNKEISKVLNITGLSALLKHKNLYIESLIDEGGFGLSGGEEQRILLARALLSGREVIVFDETFSAIDKKEREDILYRIINEYEEKMIIVISHSTWLKKNFNKIYDLEEKACIR